MTDTGETPRLRYDEGCLAANALNAIGDRWALLVVRELMLTPKRFQAIRAGIPGITAGVLTQRLAQLAGVGVVSHDAGQGGYALTASGRALYPVLVALCHWGSQHPGHDPRRFISPTALMISMTAKIDRAAAAEMRAGHDTVAAFDIGREGFRMQIDTEGRAEVRASRDPRGDFLLRGSGNALARAVYGPEPVARLARDGVIGLTGDVARAQGFVDLFRLDNQG